MLAGGCNYTVILDGWFGDLADLRQENPAIASYLLDWIANMVRPVIALYSLCVFEFKYARDLCHDYRTCYCTQVTKYGVDGLRLDTVTYVPKWFLEKFQASADVYIVGYAWLFPSSQLQFCVVACHFHPHHPCFFCAILVRFVAVLLSDVNVTEVHAMCIQ